MRAGVRVCVRVCVRVSVRVYICGSECKCTSVSGQLRAAEEGRSPWCQKFHRTEAQSVLARWLMDGWPPKLISLTNVVYT